jgi:hypothetical protein
MGAQPGSSACSLCVKLPLEVHVAIKAVVSSGKMWPLSQVNVALWPNFNATPELQAPFTVNCASILLGSPQDIGMHDGADENNPLALHVTEKPASPPNSPLSV